MKQARQSFKSANWIACVEFCLKAIMKDNSNIEAWGLCAISYGNLGKINDAIECLQEAIKIDKRQGEEHQFNLSLNLAEFYRRNNQTLKALSLLKSFLPREDENLHFNIAKCYADLQDYEQSITHYTKAIEINPKDLHAIYNLANQQAAMGSLRLALKYYMLAYEGGMGDAGINMAQIYSSMDRLEDSLSLYRKLESMYTADSNFYFNYANTLRYASDIESAKAMYYKAIAIKNDPRYIINLTYLLLSINDNETGFILYEHRRALLEKSPYRHFMNFGFSSKKNLLSFIKDKRVAILHEQGFGDSIMFIRFLVLLKSKEILLHVPCELVGLFECFSNTQGHIYCSNVAKEDYDIAIPIPSLPYLLLDSNIESSLLEFRKILLDFVKKRHKQDNTYTSVQYRDNFIDTNKILQSYSVNPVDNAPIIHTQTTHLISNTMQPKRQRGLRVGLNFASNPKFQYAREKSIYPQKLLESLPQHGFNYFSLQYEGIDSSLAKDFNVMDLSENIKNFLDTARIILDMDLIISIDSAIAHLSATLGIKTALLLHKRHDWRWGKFLENSTIWYDCVHLFKQSRLNEWEYPLQQLRIFMESLRDPTLANA